MCVCVLNILNWCIDRVETYCSGIGQKAKIFSPRVMWMCNVGWVSFVLHPSTQYIYFFSWVELKTCLSWTGTYMTKIHRYLNFVPSMHRGWTAPDSLKLHILLSCWTDLRCAERTSINTYHGYQWRLSDRLGIIADWLQAILKASLDSFRFYPSKQMIAIFE